MGDLEARRAELAALLGAVRSRIAAACAAAGRDADEVTLIAITKTFPASDVRLLAELGITDVGENRDQEAADKHAELVDLALCWHFVGQVQSRKAASVASFADVVHSVDRVKLVHALDRAAHDLDRTVRVLVQVRLDPGGDGSDGPSGAPRGGVEPAGVQQLVAEVARSGNLRLGGVMAVAPLDSDPAVEFGRLAEIAALVRGSYPTATDMSAGMSADLEAAVAAGATHLRVGSALLGRRPALG